MSRVFLTDGQQRKTLAAARSLGGRGIEVLTAEETRWALARFSKYCSKGFISPSPGRTPREYHKWLLRTLEANPCEVMFPMDDASMAVVMQHREDFDRLCRIPLPGRESYETAADKALATLAAMEAGLDCPRTIVPEDLEEVRKIAPDLNYPVMIKPRKSAGARGITAVQGQDALYRQYLRVHKDYPLPVIQEYILPGEKFDVCLLLNRSSQVKASFVQKEIRFFPAEKGPSTVQESVWRPDLVEEATRLLQHINWYGVAEVEFITDRRDGKVKFMEINPRFWASVYMAILAGVDFPWLLYQLAMDSDVPEVTTYTTGIKCRWLLPGDILHFLTSRDRFKMDPPLFSTKKSGIYDDIVSSDDPLPILGFLLACLRYLPDIKMWKLMFDR